MKNQTVVLLMHTSTIGSCGTNKERVTWDQLSPVQRMAVCCHTLRELPHLKIHEHMLDSVIHLVEYAQNLSLSAARPSHALLLYHMEQGAITGWLHSRPHRLDPLCSYRHGTINSSEGPKGHNKIQRLGIVLPCIYSRKIHAFRKNSNETTDILYMHICSALPSIKTGLPKIMSKTKYL